MSFQDVSPCISIFHNSCTKYWLFFTIDPWILPKCRTPRHNNASALFAAVDRQTNPPVSVASELPSTKSCNELASCFTDTIQKMRQAVSTTVSGICSVLRPLKTNSISMTQFDLINYETLEEIGPHLKSSSVCLDILPSQVFCIRSSANNQNFSTLISHRPWKLQLLSHS